MMVHGIVKEQEVPPREIDVAIKRKRVFVGIPAFHTHQE